MRRPRKSINQINVVPYIDVMLVLLVIFMVTAPLMSPAWSTCPASAARSRRQWRAGSVASRRPVAVAERRNDRTAARVAGGAPRAGTRAAGEPTSRW
jgi:biopolymer transport protein TolR